MHWCSYSTLIKQVRVSGYGGWFLLRLSLHDPVLPLNIEVSLVFASSTLGTLSSLLKHVFPRHLAARTRWSWDLQFSRPLKNFLLWTHQHWTNLCNNHEISPGFAHLGGCRVRQSFGLIASEVISLEGLVQILIMLYCRSDSA